MSPKNGIIYCYILNFFHWSNEVLLTYLLITSLCRGTIHSRTLVDNIRTGNTLVRCLDRLNTHKRKMEKVWPLDVIIIQDGNTAHIPH